MNPYHVGGALDPDNPDHVYVYRQADIDLLELLEKGQYCYILNSRQMGKSSLAKKTRQKLKEKNIISVIIDLSSLSSDGTKEQWYYSIANLMMESIQESKQIPNFQWEDYWRDLKLSFHVKDCLGELIKKILNLIPENLVIFLDEIDSLIKKTNTFNTDDLLTYVRYCCNNPNNIPILKRLTFCIIGVRRPGSLIQNKSITPFNIGQPVELKGFTVQEAEYLNTISLQEKLGSKENSDIALKTIIELWTNGQPFLTQKLCKLLLEKDVNISSDIPSFIENFAKKYIIQNWMSNDNPIHLGHIRSRILDDERQAVALLDIYKNILIKDAIEADDSLEQTELRLSGLVLREEGYLKPFNRIYKEVFNLDWVNERLAKIKPYTEKFEAWLEANEEIKQRYLLYGKELECASIWVEDKRISNNKDHQFLHDSQNFLRDLKIGLLGDEDQDSDDFDYQAIINSIFLWTGGIKSLNKIIIKRVKTIFKKKNKGEEETSLKTYITQRINQSDKGFNKHRQEISDHILKGNNFDPILILWSYREILDQGEVEFNESPEHQKLIDMCLIIKEGNKLQILNKIYPLLLNQAWINDQLKFIITHLVNKIWQSVTEDEQSQAVEIVIKFNSQLKGKTNPLYAFIQKVLENTVSNHDLLENLLEKACQQEYISSEYQDEWIKQQLNFLKPNDIIDQEILAWIQSYEKAIVSKHPIFGIAKKIIDIAFYELVEQLAKEFDKYTEQQPQDGNIDTVIHHIEYLANNLIRLGIWKEDDRPKIQKEGENRWKITISNCSYQEECKWALDESAFNEGEKYKKYRCQRLGCCVGVVKEYMNENLNYSMETVVDEAKGCQGFIFGGFE